MRRAMAEAVSLPPWHGGSPGSIPRQSMRDLWWTRQCDRFFSKYLGFPPVNYHSNNAPYSSPSTQSLTKSTMREEWELSKKVCSFGNQGTLDTKVLSLFSS